jgi:hypothetical protein
VTGLDLPALYQKSGAVTNSKEVVAVMLEQARKQGADSLLIVEMVRWGEIRPFHGNGFGAFNRSLFPNGCIYTSFMSTLFRVDTGKRVKSEAEPEPCEVSKTDHFEMKPAWDQYTPEERATFEAVVKEKIRAALASQLNQLSLTPPGPVTPPP